MSVLLAKSESRDAADSHGSSAPMLNAMPVL